MLVAFKNKLYTGLGISETLKGNFKSGSKMHKKLTFQENHWQVIGSPLWCSSRLWDFLGDHLFKHPAKMWSPSPDTYQIQLGSILETHSTGEVGLRFSKIPQ